MLDAPEDMAGLSRNEDAQSRKRKPWMRNWNGICRRRRGNSHRHNWASVNMRGGHERERPWRKAVRLWCHSLELEEWCRQSQTPVTTCGIRRKCVISKSKSRICVTSSVNGGKRVNSRDKWRICVSSFMCCRRCVNSARRGWKRGGLRGYSRDHEWRGDRSNFGRWGVLQGWEHG